MHVAKGDAILFDRDEVAIPREDHTELPQPAMCRANVTGGGEIWEHRGETCDYLDRVPFVCQELGNSRSLAPAHVVEDEH